MADYVVNLTGSTEVDDSIVKEFSQQVIITHGEIGNADAFVSMKEEIGNTSGISMPVYNHLAINTTALNEREELESKQLSDSGITLIPAEYGDVITKTTLASLKTGGKVDLAAARLVGINMAQVQNKLALMAADQSTNVLFGGGVGAIGDVGAAHVMTGALADKAYNKLSRRSVPGLPQALGAYVAIAHDDVLADIRNSAGFEDLKKHQAPEELARNIVGFYKGCYWVRDNLSTIAMNAGASNTEVYSTYFLGFNGLGKATSLAPQVRFTGPFDKLARFANIGWYGVFKYGIVQPEAVWVVKTASSVAP